MEKGILRPGQKQGPKVLWTALLAWLWRSGRQRRKVYLLDRDDKSEDNLKCLDLSSGKELWNFAYDAPYSATIPVREALLPWIQ